MSTNEESTQSVSVEGAVSERPKKEKKRTSNEGFVEFIDGADFKKKFWTAMFLLLVIALLGSSMHQQFVIDNILNGLGAQGAPTVQQVKVPAESTALQKMDSFLRVYADDVAYTKSTDLPAIYLGAKTVCADLDAGKTLNEVRADWVNNPRGTITNREVAPLTRDAILTLCPSKIDWLQVPPYATVITP